MRKLILLLAALSIAALAAVGCGKDEAAVERLVARPLPRP